VVLILVYITLDLSLASMPGAFVFEAGESVETAQLNRGRHFTQIEPAPAPARDRNSVVIADVEVRQPAVPRPVRPMPLRRGDRSPASTAEPPALSEESH
jgi:hypothetical protein